MSKVGRYLLQGAALVYCLLAISQACIALPEDLGLPSRLNDLRVLGTIENEQDLSQFDKTEMLTVWLIRERQDPSQTTRGLGGDISSGYIQAQIITALFTMGDPLIIAEIASDENIDPAIRDAMRIVLGLKGDAAQIPELIRILEYSNEGYFRAKAAEALALLGATEATPALQKALQDEFWEEGSSCFSFDVIKVYPVRRYAASALALFNLPDRLNSAKARNQEFAQRIRNMKEGSASLSTYFESEKWNIEWDNTNKRAAIRNRNDNTQVVVGNGYAKINGKDISLPQPPVLADGRLLIPNSSGVKLIYAASPLSQMARLPAPMK